MRDHRGRGALFTLMLMRAIVQRVSSASVTVDDKVVGRIGRGLLVYLGVGQGDGADDVSYLANKVAYLRIFEDDAGKMNRDVSQIGGDVLVVSNFTLHADTRQGRRPAFTDAAPAEVANALYEDFCTALRGLGLHVETGVFRERMNVASENEGPINIIIDSKTAR